MFYYLNVHFQGQRVNITAWAEAVRLLFAAASLTNERCV